MLKGGEGGGKEAELKLKANSMLPTLPPLRLGTGQACCRAACQYTWVCVCSLPCSRTLAPVHLSNLNIKYHLQADNELFFLFEPLALTLSSVL